MKKVLLLLSAIVVLSALQAQNHIEYKWHGFYGVAGYDFAINLNKTSYEDKVTFNGFTAIGGFQIRKESGVGLGVSLLRDSEGAFSQLPIFVELRSHYMRSRVTPFTSIYAGYSLPLGSSSGGENSIQIATGGVVTGLSVGARFALTRKIGFNVHVGYQQLFMNRVERMVDGIRADAQPLLLHNLKLGAGVNF